MKTLLANLPEQQAPSKKQRSDLTFSEDDNARHGEGSSSLSSELMTPPSGSFNDPYSSSDNKEGKQQKVEVARLKQELDAAKNQIARQKQELDQTRIMKHTIHQAVGSPAELEMRVNDLPSSSHQDPASPLGRNGGFRQDSQWDTRSIMSDSTSVDNFNNAQQVWGPQNRQAFANSFSNTLNQQHQPAASAWGQPGARPWANRNMTTNLQPVISPQQQQMLQSRTFSGPASPIANNDFSHFQAGQGLRRSNTQPRAASFFPQARNTSWDVFGNGAGSLDSMNAAMNPGATYQAIGMYPATVPYQPQPIGTPLSPEAAEFRAGQASTNPWNINVSVRLVENRHP